MSKPKTRLKRTVPRSLYDCSNAVVEDGMVKCRRGHELKAPIGLRQVMLGEPLVVNECQRCRDFDPMGPPVDARERGWVHLVSKRRRQ